MSEFSINDVGVKVGLEIHQQLATNKKLFCNCTPLESDEYFMKFQRKLRASKSELGEYDPAVLFEKSKSKTIMYYANPESSCLVEQDEEPPHELDEDARKIALVREENCFAVGPPGIAGQYGRKVVRMNRRNIDLDRIHDHPLVTRFQVPNEQCDARPIIVTANLQQLFSELPSERQVSAVRR